MQRRLLMDKLLQEEEKQAKTESDKGVCQSCGHYTRIFLNRFGTRVCRLCEDKLENELKKDFFS